MRPYERTDMNVNPLKDKVAKNLPAILGVAAVAIVATVVVIYGRKIVRDGLDGLENLDPATALIMLREGKAVIMDTVGNMYTVK
jgi:hypothetical protein